MKTNLKKRIRELEQEVLNEQFKRNLDLLYISKFIYAIKIGAFDKQFVEALFSDDNLDLKLASRDIMQFIIVNRRRWKR